MQMKKIVNRIFESSLQGGFSGQKLHRNCSVTICSREFVTYLPRFFFKIKDRPRKKKT